MLRDLRTGTLDSNTEEIQTLGWDFGFPVFCSPLILSPRRPTAILCSLTGIVAALRLQPGGAVVRTGGAWLWLLPGPVLRVLLG